MLNSLNPLDASSTPTSFGAPAPVDPHLEILAKDMLETLSISQPGANGANRYSPLLIQELETVASSSSQRQSLHRVSSSVPHESPLLSNQQIRRLAREREDFRKQSEQLKQRLGNVAAAATSLEVVVGEMDQQLRTVRDEYEARRLSINEPQSQPHEVYRDAPILSYNEIQMLTEERDRLNMQLAQSEDTIRQNKLNIAHMTSRISNLETQLKLTREELGASRAFVTDETTYDARELIVRLTDINEAVDDLAFRVIQHPPFEDLLAQPFTRDAAIALLKGANHRATMFWPLAAFTLENNVAISNFIHPLIQHLLFHILARQIFEPFIPGLSNAQDEPTHALYKLISTNEPQNRAARWRSITYQHAHPRRDDMTLVTLCGQEFVTVLQNMIRRVAPDLPLVDLKSFADSVEKIVLDAIKWQDHAQTNYLGYDYTSIVPWDEPFDVTRMKPDEGGSRFEGQHVVACVGIGLSAVHNVISRTGSGIHKDTTVPLKSIVLCGEPPDWAWFSTYFHDRIIFGLPHPGGRSPGHHFPNPNLNQPVVFATELESGQTTPTLTPANSFPILLPADDDPDSSPPISRTPSAISKTRQKIWGLVNEFAHTEKSYYSKVRLLYDAYLYPLWTAGYLPENCSNLLLNVTAIMNASCKFIAALEKQSPHAHDAPFWVGIALFDCVLSVPANVVAYIEYIGHHQETTQLFHAASKAMPRSGPHCYAEFEKRARRFLDGLGKIRDPTASLLMEPVQRLPRYRLLLSELMKFPHAIPESDRQALSMAHEGLDRILKAAELAGLIVSGVRK